MGQSSNRVFIDNNILYCGYKILKIMLALIVKLSYWIKIHHSKTNITSLFRSNKRVLLQHMGSTKEYSFLESSLNETSPVVLRERCKHYILYARFSVKAYITDLLMRFGQLNCAAGFCHTSTSFCLHMGPQMCSAVLPSIPWPLQFPELLQLWIWSQECMRARLVAGSGPSQA